MPSRYNVPLVWGDDQPLAVAAPACGAATASGTPTISITANSDTPIRRMRAKPLR